MRSINRKTFIEITLIVLLALFIRVVGIHLVPPSLNWDEVSHGYNAYSIINTGRDEWGNLFPTIFRAYGDYKLPVYIYTTVISELIFGFNSFAVRFPSILAGTSIVLFTFLISKKLFKNTEIAFISAFLAALSPWSFFLSRVAVEANLSVSLIVAATYFFLSKKYNISFVLFGLSVWTYNSARIFTPLLLISLIFIYRKEVIKYFNDKRKMLISTFLILVFFVPMFLQLLNSQGQARYENVRIIDEGAISQIESSRNNSQLPDLVDKLIYNKPVYFISTFIQNYVKHFSPQFLFTQGGSNYQFNVPGWGLLYLVTLPLFYIGIYVSLKNIKDRSFRLLLIWLLLAPIASSLTREAPHTLRSVVMLPVPMLLSSYVINLRPKLLPFFATLIGISFLLYANSYFSDYRKNYSWSWQYGHKQMVNFIKSNYTNYDKIIVTKKYGEPHEFLLFYFPWEPSKYQNDMTLNRFYQSNWYWVDGFDKFYFVNDWEIPESGEVFTLESKETVDCYNTRCLLVTSPGNRPFGWNNIETIPFLNGEISFELYENK